jgi:N-acetylglucosamine malate deacetylase 2
VIAPEREASAWPLRRLLADLAGDGPILQRLMIVVAHPDDETIALGGQMWRLRDALIVHVTDGAPRDGEDARSHGFSVITDYAAARRREFAAAIVAGEAAGVRTAQFGLPDKEACRDLAGLSRGLAQLLRRERPAAVLTHAYEGGHPDHDAAAFAVAAACRLLAPAERPAVLEMPLYHVEDGDMVRARFLDARTGEFVRRLSNAEVARKKRMVDCFRTQRDLLAGFALDPERFRPAPRHDFREPPHPGPLLYETFGWGIAGNDWRRRAGEALAALGIT